jgi:hypothetical protein
MAASIPVLRVFLREIKSDADNLGHENVRGYGYGIAGGAYYAWSVGTHNSAARYSLSSPVASGSHRGTGNGSIHQSTLVTVTGGKKYHNHYPGSPVTKQGSGGLGLGADDQSDKSILNDSQGSVFDAAQQTPRRHPSVGGKGAKTGGQHGGIMQTNEVSIDYENTYILDEKFDEKERHVDHMA